MTLLPVLNYKRPAQYTNLLPCIHRPVVTDAADIVRREEVAEGKIPFTGYLGTIKHHFDATSSERDLLGHPFKSYDEQVKDTIKWYVHLKD